MRVKHRFHLWFLKNPRLKIRQNNYLQKIVKYFIENLNKKMPPKLYEKCSYLQLYNFIDKHTPEIYIVCLTSTYLTFSRAKLDAIVCVNLVFLNYKKILINLKKQEILTFQYKLLIVKYS